MLYRSFLDALLPHMTKLSAVVPSGRSRSNSSSGGEEEGAAKLSLLRLLARMLSLDAGHMLRGGDPPHPSFDFIFDSYCSFLAPRYANSFFTFHFIFPRSFGVGNACARCAHLCTLPN